MVCNGEVKIGKQKGKNTERREGKRLKKGRVNRIRGNKSFVDEEERGDHPESVMD